MVYKLIELKPWQNSKHSKFMSIMCSILHPQQIFLDKQVHRQYSPYRRPKSEGSSLITLNLRQWNDTYLMML